VERCWSHSDGFTWAMIGSSGSKSCMYASSSSSLRRQDNQNVQPSVAVGNRDAAGRDPKAGALAELPIIGGGLARLRSDNPSQADRASRRLQRRACSFATTTTMLTTCGLSVCFRFGGTKVSEGLYIDAVHAPYTTRKTSPSRTGYPQT